MSLINIKEELPEQVIARKQAELDTLEAAQYMQRGEREGWISLIEAQASAQNVNAKTLYKANPFYKKLKDVNDRASELRAELRSLK